MASLEHNELIVLCIFSVRRQYPPITLHQLQRLIDLGRLDTTQPIDLTSLCNTKITSMNLNMRHYGVNLTDEVMP